MNDLPRTFGNISLIRAARTTSGWASLTTYVDLAAQWGTYASGTAVGGVYALASGTELGVAAPGLLPFPRGGWGFTAASGTVISPSSATASPEATPIRTISGSLPTDDADYPHVAGSGTLVYAADTREIRILRPPFVQRTV